MNDDNKKVNANTENTDETEMSLDELDAVAGGYAPTFCFTSGDGLCLPSGYTDSSGDKVICLGGGKCPNAGVDHVDPKCIGFGL